MMEDQVIVFLPPDVHQPSHLASDIMYWKTQYKLLANACFEHNRAIEKVIENNNKYMVNMRRKGALENEERRFFKEMKLYQEILGQQVEKLKHDANEYIELEKNLKSFSDDPALRIAKLDNMYKLARDRLKAQTKILEDAKRDYQKSMFAMEKAEIKKMLATRNEVVDECKAKVEELEAKATIQISVYTKHLDKWQLKFDRLEKLSAEFEGSYLKREEARADKVLAVIQKSLELTNSGMNAKRDPAFTDLNARDIIQEKVIKHEIIAVPSFEEYVKQEDTSEVYARARLEVEQEEGRLSQQTARKHIRAGSAKSAHSERPDKESMEDRLETNKLLKLLRNEKLHLVTKAYKKQGVNQINLKVGEYVKQLLPENEDGLAFGEVVHGLLHKKKKGFYPVCHVTVVDTSDEDKVKDGHGAQASKSTESARPKKGKKTRECRQKRRSINEEMGVGQAAGRSIDNVAKQFGDAVNGPDDGSNKKQKKGVFGALKQRFKRKKSKATADEEPTEYDSANDDTIDGDPIVTLVQVYTTDDDNEAEEALRQSRKRKPKAAFQDVSNATDGLEQVNECNVNARRRRREKKGNESRL